MGRYHNSDPVLVNYLIRLAVEKRGEEYLSFPQRALFDKIGVRTMVMETDPFGNFLTQGYEYASARDWARLGNLYLQDGMWNGRAPAARGLREVRQHAGAGVEGGQAAGLRRLLLDQRRRQMPVPAEAYYMAGAGGQTTLIIPSHDLVVVRLGHYKGSAPGSEASTRRWRC